MPANQEESRRSAVLSVLMHTAAALVITLALLMLAAVFVAGGAVPVSALVPVSVIAVFVGTMAGGFRAARKRNGRRLPSAVAVGVIAFLFMLVVGMMFSFPPSGTVLPVLLAALGGGLLGGFLSTPRAKKKRR